MLHGCRKTCILPTLMNRTIRVTVPTFAMCITMYFGSMRTGMDATIDPQGTTLIPYKRPSIMWHSKYRVRAMSGENVKMKCIFAGYPTPDVTWKRLDGAMPSNAIMSSFGMELIIERVQFKDKGKYCCLATNANQQNSSQLNMVKSEENFILNVECEFHPLLSIDLN